TKWRNYFVLTFHRIVKIAKEVFSAVVHFHSSNLGIVKMEGYTNISGDHEDFDDLDIEGRITVDEWNCEDDERLSKEKAANDREEKRLLSIKVKLDGGGFGYVFSVKTSDHAIRWNCHLCDVLIIGQKHVDTHIQSKKHQIKMALPSHPANLFKRIDNKSIVEMPTLAPGEPVPPGFEDVVKRVTQIQATLDRLEYLVELTPDESGKEPTYVCMLCDKKGDPRVAMAHIASLSHRHKYIGIHYPTANKAMFNDLPRSRKGRRAVSEIVTRICAKIEEKYGRLQPMVADRETFETKKDQIMRQIQLDRHFRETPEETFVEFVDKSILNTIDIEEVADPVKDENKNESNLKSTFIKGKISCDRSRLRLRGLEETEEEIKYGKLELERKKPGPGIKKRKVNSADSSRKSLSSISSLSSSSRSRSPSRSRSKSYSRSRSRSRSRYNRYSYREGKYGRSRRVRSRSGSRGWRRSRSGSRSRSRRSRSFSPGSRYLRRESPDSPGRRHRYHRSRSPKYNRYHDGSNDDRYNKHRDKSVRDKSDSADPRVLERTKWMKFRQEVDKIERELAKELKFHEKNPEKHPMYPEEWKKFWNRRYKELQASGQDPSKHDFKPEWIEFWNKRMKEMHEEALKTKKEEIRLKLSLPKEEELIPYRTNRKNRSGQDSDVIIISPPSNNEEEVIKKDITVTDIKNTWKALTGSDIKDTSRRSPSPWEEGEPLPKHMKPLSPSRRPIRGGGNLRGKNRSTRLFGRMCDELDGSGIVKVLRHLTALESQLGSLGPRINTLLASALSLEKASLNSSNHLLANSDNFVLLETVKEKLKGQLLAGIVERNMVMATRSGIDNLSELLARAEESGVTSSGSNVAEPTSVSVPRVPAAPVAPVIPVAKVIPAEPVTVPGIGTMDKVAIAQQIASALVAQGKTDVTQEELEQLINAVVGMAQASAGSENPISTASYVSQMQQHLSGNTLSDKLTKARGEETSLQKHISIGNIEPSVSSSQKNIAKTDPKTSALALLQSAYDEPKISPGGTISKIIVNQKDGIKDSVSLLKQQLPSPATTNTGPGQHLNKSDMDDLTEEDLQTLLQNFNDLSAEEQHGLITYLKKLETKDPQRVEKLRQYVTMGNEENTSQKPSQNLKSSLKSSRMTSEQLGRLSPFSLRQGGINPSQESEQVRKEFSNNEVEEDQKNSLKLEDSDDDYSFEDIYKAASQNVKEREKAKLEEEKAKQMIEVARGKDVKSSILKKKTDDPSLILKETKEMIANLMGQLPSKYIQKQAGSPGSRKDSPSVLGNQSNVSGPTQRTETTPSAGISGQRIQALGSDTSQMQVSGQTVPTLETSRRMYQAYPNSNTYTNQYSTQNFPGGQQSYPAVQQQGYSAGYQQNNGYYGNAQQQYPQNVSGNYMGPYSNHGNQGGWSQYPDQYGQQQQYQQHPAPGSYNQYPNQPSNYY
ncbi:hypothetical protein C0J52_13212, partial [Blattella germanica]